MTATTKPRGTWARYRGGVRLPRLGVGLLAAAGLLGLGLSSMGAVSAHTQTLRATSASGGSYVAVTPFRVADTRPNSGQPYAGMTLGAQQTLNVQVTGMGNVPAGAAAAVLNVTAVDPTAAGFLTVFPEGTTMPTVSNLNFAAGDTVPNLVTVGLSSSGMVSIYNSAGSTNVVVDVDGYYMSAAASNGSGLYNPLSPTRVMGTLQSGQAVGPNSVASVTVAGSSASDGVPANATAVVVNVTAANATAPSFLTVYPAGNTTPLASNLNFGAQMPNQAIANRVTVGVGSGGQIDVYNHAGTVNVDVDVDGYYTGSGGTGSTFVAIQPVRLTDTRSNMNGTPIAASSSETFSLTNSSIPSTAAAVAANFTVIPGDMPGYLTVYPTSDSTVPVASDVNWTANESPAVPNYTIADTAGTGSVDAFNSHGATINLVIDAFGYFGPSNAPTVYTVTPSAAQTETVSTSGAPQQGAVQYTASGLGTSPVNIELFAGANVTSTSPLTFASSAIDSNGDAEPGSTVSFIETVNGFSELGNPTSGHYPSMVTDITPVNGSVTFTINSDTAGSDVPVVYAYNSANASNQVLPVNSNGNPTVSAGAGGEITWSSVVASSGTYDGYTVTSIGPATDTFAACESTTCYTFTYGQAGSSYAYDETPGSGGTTTPLPISEAEFSSYLNIGDEFNISYGGASNPGTFDYIGKAQSGTGNVPYPPSGVTATYVTSGSQQGTVAVSWTAPANPDVYQYQVYVAVQASNGTYGTPTAVTSADGGVVSGTENTTTGVVETAPATSTHVTAPAAGSTVEYTVAAIADGNNTSQNSGQSSASTAVTVPTPTYPPFPTSGVETAAAGESGAGNTVNDAITFNDSALGLVGATALYASSVSDFATVTSGQVTLLPDTLGAVTSASGATPATDGDSVVIFNAGTSSAPQYFYVDVTSEVPASGATGSAYVGVVVSNSGGNISITFNGTSDNNTTSTDYLYIPVATGTNGSQTGWTLESPQTFDAQVVTSGSSGAIAAGTYALDATVQA